MNLFKSIVLFLVVFFISSSALSQVKTYPSQWKKVDELIKKSGRPATALAEVKKIYTLAKKENQQAQIIKSLVYMAALQQSTREDNLEKSIREMEKELVTLKEPAASILKSILATHYWNYFSYNRYELFDRTETTGFKKEDINTWTIRDFYKRISELYLASLNNSSVLKKTSLKPFDAIIDKGNLRHLRPTLYDLLAHQALNYFKRDETDLTRPSYAFEISQPSAFAPASQFISQKFDTRDTTSLQHKALLIYQDLVRFHLDDKEPSALIDADISRIEFVYENYTGENKDSLYLNALRSVSEKYPSHAEAHQARYLLARWHMSKADSYAPNADTSYRYHRVMALDILNQIIADSSRKTRAWHSSMLLQREIIKPSFSFHIEQVNIPATPFRVLVEYRNEEKLYLKLVRATPEIKSQFERNRHEDDFWESMMNLPADRTWEQDLPATNDYQLHSVEIKVDALPEGEYYLVASSSKTYHADTTRVGARLFHVSNISYVHQGEDLFVLHRETGLPLVNASVAVYRQQYNYNTSEYIRNDVASFSTDVNGYIKLNIPGTENHSYHYFDITHHHDSLDLGEAYYGYNYSDREEGETKINSKTFFFTDRSIYRPGQTLFFKGIIVNSIGKANKVGAGEGRTVFLYDANHEIKDSLRLMANDNGSFHGRFHIPAGLLTGTYHLRSSDGSTVYFSVEEYKRPKFKVEFDPVDQSYRVNDTVTVQGKAQAYAGNNVDGAKVSYRVTRKPRFIYRWYFRSWLPPAEEMVITHGETTTDADGSFSIDFKAIPDKSIDVKSNPVFDYEISVDITDINGETRSNTTTVSAGYKSILLIADIPGRIHIDSLKSLSVITQNMNGVYQPSTITVTAHKLQPEQRLIRERLWKQPDQFVMNREEYIRSFPHDEYNNETDMSTWTKLDSSSATDSTHANGKWAVGRSLIPSTGFYELEIITHDNQGNEVRDVKYMEVYDDAGGFNRPEYLWLGKRPSPIEPGEQTELELGTAASQVFLLQQVAKDTGKGFTEVPIGQKGKQPIPVLEHQEQEAGYRFHTLNHEKRNFPFTATEADRGGYGISFLFVKHNRVYTFSDVISVPWTNKELKIEYASFRDKTLPGSEENWKVKITGLKGEQVAAEMLASMYDASLDQFRIHQWTKPGIWSVFNRPPYWRSDDNFTSVVSNNTWIDNNYQIPDFSYDRLIATLESARIYPEMRMGNDEGLLSMKVMAAPVMADSTAEFEEKDADGIADDFDVAEKNRRDQNEPEIQVRKNFNETAFFFPELRTNADGSIEFSFTAPEALTAWKLQTLAHTNDLAFGYASKELVTQKQLMVQPNMPRFLRQGDRLELNAKIVNLSEKELTGQVQLMLFNASTQTSVDGYFINTFPNQYFTAGAGQSVVVKFPIQVPFQFNDALTWRIVAVAENFSDGEENVLPVLSNQVLVTETITLPVKGAVTKNFSFDKLKQSGNSETLKHHALTVEYTSNPVWYAVQSLPYLMEYPYDCAEQIWNRIYANALASHIVKTMPRIKQVFDQWKTLDTSALLSNLEKNQELKSALLEETPWVLQAKNESEQKKNIALLFDLTRMSNEMQSNIGKLKQMQSSNGGFVWFKGGPDDRFITQYIITGIGRLRKMGVDITPLQEILSDAMPYLDKKIKEDYDQLIKQKVVLGKQQPGSFQVQYLYMRSFFTDRDIPAASKTAYNYFRKQSQTFWLQQSKYLQGMTALALHRTGDHTLPGKILISLKENSILHEELGRYWKDNRFGISWWWAQAPIETQALMIEAFHEIRNDKNTVDELRTWLLKNKQTNNWRTTKATADAVYAMLLRGTNWLAAEPKVEISLGNMVVGNNENSEAGTGYFKQTIPAENIQPQMGDISVKISAANQDTGSIGTSWGAVYWQYFEDMDKITGAATPLQLQKKLFVQKNTDRGPVLSPVEENSFLQIGDRIVVRIELRVDRDMEYVHMKDLRASSLEPVNVLSGYRWQGSLGYYESTRDLSTNFFFNQLRKGTYVFEYPLFVTHSGNFTSGITTIQCMYAPEFSAHSEGIRISVD